MNVAIFSSTLDITCGYGNITYELCKNLHKRGVAFTLFLPKDEKASGDIPIDFPIRKDLPSYIFRPLTPKVIPYFLADIDLSSFTLVHSLFEFPYAFMGARLARKYSLPFIMGGQGTYAVLPLTRFPDRQMLLYAYKTAREIMVPSVFTKNAIDHYARQSFPVAIVHNGVNLERFSRDFDVSEPKKEYEKNQILLTVGTLSARKGHDIVIRALPKILETYPNTVYLIVGEGIRKKFLLQLAGECGVSDKVIFVGNLRGDELVKYFKMCDIYVHTPRVKTPDPYFEGFGIVYLEASACGKPIVATDAGGIRDAVLDGRTGFVAPNEDSQSVAKYCIQLLSDKALRDRMGEEGKTYARSHAWPMIADQFIERYKKYSHEIPLRP